MARTLVINGRRWRVWRIPPLPRYWIPISPPGGLAEPMRSEWPLILGALRIPFWRTVPRDRPCLIVPCFLEKYALGHIADVEAEPKGSEPEAEPAGHPEGRSLLSCLLLVPVLLAHALRSGAVSLPVALGLPAAAADWPALFGLDTVRVKIFHEFHRCVTALLLHADAAHLAGNMAFSAFFLHFLSRVAGPGAAILLTVLGGSLGNAANAFAHREYVMSIGFSTALFACVGALSGHQTRRSKARALLPLAGGGGLLAMLGTEGAGTDYTAHVCGLLAGILLGLAWALAEERWPWLARGPAQWAAGLAGFAILGCAIFIAL